MDRKNKSITTDSPKSRRRGAVCQTGREKTKGCSGGEGNCREKKMGRRKNKNRKGRAGVPLTPQREGRKRRGGGKKTGD